MQQYVLSREQTHARDLQQGIEWLVSGVIDADLKIHTMGSQALLHYCPGLSNPVAKAAREGCIMDRPVEFLVLRVDAHDGDAGEDELRPPPLADGCALRQRELHRHRPARAGHAVIARAGRMLQATQADSL